MTSQQLELWEKINQFEIDDEESSFTFTDRLARENDWTIEYSLRAVHEYKKFMFLICLAEHPLTPSDEVDQVWHLHLIYTRSYWEDFCGKTLGKIIHHGPTKGGTEERTKFIDWYEKTLEFYKEVFKLEPPKDIWPKSKDRFGEVVFTRVNRHKNWVFKKWF